MKKNREKKKMIIGIILMFLAVVVAVITYLYYLSMQNNVTGTILAWECVNNETKSGILNLGSLKPGSNGKINFKVKPIDSNANIEIKMKFGNTDTIPADLKFYENNIEGNEIALNRTGGTESAYITAFSEADVKKNSNKIYTIFYKWALSGTDEVVETSNKSLVLNYTITCK